MGNPTPNGWTKDTDFMINTGTGTADEWYIYAYVSKNQYFALNNGSNQYGPTTANKEIKNGSGGGTGNYNSNAWKFVGSSGIIKICCAESNNREWYPYVWVEESAPTIKFKHPWNGSSWSEQTATKQSDGTYTYDGQYGNKKAFNAGPSGKYKYNESQTTVEGSPSTGDMCRFIWNPVGYVQGGAETKASGTFKIVKLCSLTYNGNGNTGGTVPSATNNQLYNTSITLSSTTLTKNGYTHTGWNTKADGTGDHYDKGASYTLTAVSATLYAEWAENTYSVTISAGNGGTVSPSGSKTIGQVTKTTVTATPNANYEFVNWTATGGVVVANTTSASTTITATATGRLTANFRSTATNSLTVVAGANIESVTGSTDPVTLGNTYPITATPETGYTFSTWTANPAANATFGSATTANTTVTVKNGSVTVTATGKEQLYALTTANSYSTGNPGYTSPTKSRNDIGVETTAEVTATAAGADYIFTGWTLTNCERTDGGADNAATITIRANGNGAAMVTANYTAKTLVRLYYYNNNNWSKVYAYIWNPTTNGNNAIWPGVEITSNVEETNYTKYYYYEYYQEDHPGWSRIVFSNGSGSQTTDITYDATTHNGQYYFVNKWVATPTVIWTFAGTMNNWDTNTNPLVCTSATSGYVEFTLDANTEYKFKFVNKIEQNGDTWYGVSSVTQITYSNQATAQTMNNTSGGSSDQTMLTAGAGVYRFTWDITNKKVTVTYPTSYTVTYSQTPPAAADAPTTNPSITSGNYVAAGTSVTFTAKTANTGYTFKGWYDNNTGTGDALSTNLAYTCTINANTTIYAVYTVNTYNINIVANPTEAAESLTTSPQAVGAEKVNISTTAKFTYKFDNWTATDGITITDASSPSTSITATKAGTVTANFIQLQPTTVYLKPGDNWKQANARFAIHYWHEGQPTGWVDMTEIGCNRDYFVGTIPAGYTEFMFVRMNPANPENKWNADIDWNQTGNLTIPTDGKNLFTLPTSGDNKWDGATTTWSTYTEPTHDITINAPESGTITVTIDGNTTTVTNEATTIEDVALNAQMDVLFEPATGYELGKAIIQIGNNEKASTAGTYTVCGPTEITAYFVTEKDQVVYLRPTDAWLANNARFVAYAFNRYAGTEAAQWIELTTKDTDYTGAFSGTIPAGFSHVQFVRMPETGDFSFDIDLAQTLNYSIPTDGINNRFILGSQISSGSDKDNYQGSWEANDTPIYGIPGDWQGNKNWSADAYPLMGPNGEVTVNITQTNTTLGFKVYSYPYATTDDDQWLGNNSTMVRGGDAVHEGGWTMEINKNNCGLYVDIAGNYIFNFNIRNKKLTVTYPELPVPEAITVTSRRLYDNTELDWFEGNGTEANPYKLYNDEAIRLTVSPLTEVAGLTAYYKVGDNEEQTSNVFDWEETMSEPTKTTIQAYYKNATGTSTETVSVETPYYIHISLPFYLMTEPSGEINIDRVVAGENILVQFRSDAAATVGLYVKIGNGEEQKLTDITSTISTDYTHDVDDNIAPCVLHYIARSTTTVHGRTFEAKADVAIYKNVIIKVHDPEGWVKNAYMWRDYSDAVLTQWPGDLVLQNFGTWRVFSVKYPYYDRFIVNDGKAEGATQTIDYVLPADDTCYELLDPADNGSSDPADAGKYGLQIADCPENLIVEDIEDVTLMEGEQIVVMPKIFVGLGYQVADIEASVSYDDPTSIKAMMSGTNVTILGNAEGESNVTVTYILDNVRIEKTFTVRVTKRTKITIQVKVSKEGTSGAVGWTNHEGVYLRYWHTGDGTNLLMKYLKDVGDYDYYEADVPLDANGETNFHLFYEKIDDNEKWRQTINKTEVKEDGCYLVTQDGGNYYRGLEYEGVRCLTDQYQVRIAMGSGKTYTSNTVTAEEDTLSFFAPGMNETGYKAGVIMLYQNDKMIATIEPSTFAVSNVYTATLNDALNGLDNVSTYSGNFYIRTWGTSYATVGFVNGKGWHSIKDLTAVEKDSVRFTKFTSREGEFYNHYWVQAMNTGTYDGKDVSACVANEYNDDLAGKLLQDKHTDEKGDIKVGTDKVINVRFGYDPRTNYFGRAILQGSEYDTYLNLHCNNAYRDKDCTKQFPYGNSNVNNKMYDISNWVYQRDIYVPITNNTPSASLYIEATSPNTTKTVKDHLLGYVTNEITGEATTTPIQKTIIGSGTTNGTYLMRIIYDFKTNRLIAAWLPQGTVEVNTEKTLNADVLFVREENKDVPQINLSNQGKIKSLESMFFAMELHRGDKDAERQVEQYWFTLPFDCKVGSISGVHGYLQIWGIQRYRGDLRAQKGWYAETPTFWEWLDTEDVMHAGEGYLLVFDKKNAPFEEIEVDKMDAEGNIIDGQKETISMMRLYFPSTTSGFDMQQQSAEQLTRTYENHTCTLKLHDRYLQDSNWKVIGTTSYNNAGITGYTVDTNPEYEEFDGNEAPKFRYSYDYNWENGKFNYEYTAEDGETAIYKSFYGYMVQFAGTISWQPIMSETVPEGIAARRYVPANERTSFTTRLEIANAEGEKQDQTFVALDEKATTTFDQNLDLNKVMNSHKANIYTLSEGIPFAGNTLPMEKATVPVGVVAATAGEYTFRMPDGTDGISVFLIDNQTGAQTNMLLDEYTVTLDAGTCENRFYLAVDPDRTATSVENIGEEAKGEEAKDQIKKFLIDGQLFIRTADGTFDAKGQRL
ncbi:MAG: InlB B-repeat-containing protein [Paludibacteraceae bacterium]|nr:InlB B-repeat-containing protein [Paludibacteraceae bacterium]